jgi:hypothetical protein
MSQVIPTNWTPHRRASDHELVGYLVSDEQGSTPLTVFGYPLAGPSARADAVRILETRGLAALAEPWWLRTSDGDEVKVLLLAAYPDAVTAVRADYGFYDHTSERFHLTVPVSALRPV